MFTSIVVGTDGSETAAKAVRRAIGLALGLEARACRSSAPTSRRPINGCAAEQTQVPGDLQWTAQPARRTCWRCSTRRRPRPTQAGRQRGRDVRAQGDAADAILDVAEEQGADLIVVGNKGMTGAKRFLLGSVPNKVSHHAPCSVLIVRTS